MFYFYNFELFTRSDESDVKRLVLIYSANVRLGNMILANLFAQDFICAGLSAFAAETEK